jgi:DNA invertase Pin-like site-specific DNA recombinase
METSAPKDLRLIGYVRVSRVGGRAGDSFISPAQQRDRITAWAAAYGHQLVDVHEELDESGARVDRPKLLAAIKAIEDGQADGIVVAKLDRFGRSLVDGLQLIDRIHKAGGTFVSVADGFDLTTDTGRLVLRIMLTLAEFELDRVRGNWHDAKARAVARGIHVSAQAPFGYERKVKGQPLTVHPVNGPLVTELFQRRADGAGYTALSNWLEDRGAVTQRGRVKWSLRAVKDIIGNDVYLGVASAGELRNEAAHEPLTDPVTFRRSQRPGVRPGPSDDPSPIRNLLRCAGCRYTVRADRRNYAHGPAWIFTCRNHGGSKSSQRCDEPASIKEQDAVVQTFIEDRFLAEVGEVVARMRERAPELEPLARDVAFAQASYEEWRDDSRVQERLGMDAYLDGLASRQDKLNEALARHAAAAARHDQVALPVDVGELRAHWHELTDDEKREILSGFLMCVFIRGRSSSPRPLDERLKLVWRGERVDLPVRGSWDWLPASFRFEDGLDDDVAAETAR